MAKEIIKENKVPMTLFVGMGGIGSKIIKGVAEKCRGSENDNINFVVLDTNVNDLTAVKSSGKKIYYVQTSNTKSVGDYLKHDEDALENWFPRNSVMYSKTVSEGAGQVRAISRLALNSTIKLGRMAALYEAIDDLFRKTGKDLNQALRVVFAASATGGTGSGMTLPLTMFIRNYVNEKYPNSAVIIRGMLLLPEVLDKEIKSLTEKNSLRRNAYATVKEINAFMMKGSGFFDNTPELKRYSDLHIDVTVPASDKLKRLDLLPFDFCFLFDGQNAEDHTLTSINQYIQQASQCLYEQNIGPMQTSAFSIEDNIIKELSTAQNLGRNRFGGLGASVIKYPYEDIADYIAYQWAIDKIGGEGEAAKWSKYDNKYEAKKREEKKKGIPESEMTGRGKVYTDLVSTLTDNFSVNLQNLYVKNADGYAIPQFIRALEEHIAKSLRADEKIGGARKRAESAVEIDFKDAESNSGQARTQLQYLRSYETIMKDKAEEVAEREANAIFLNENKTINIKEPYYIETALKSGEGAIHPNAMRYVLYKLQERMEAKYTEFKGKETSKLSDLNGFSNNPGIVRDSGVKYDVSKTRKEEEKTIDDVCKLYDDGVLKGSTLEEVSKKLTDSFEDFNSTIEDYGKAVTLRMVYQIGKNYIDELNRQFLNFYNTFSDKTIGLERKQEDLVAALRFRKGDSYYNVCSDEDILKEMAKRSKISDSEEMLPQELCANIFDAVKLNVRVERENSTLDVVESDNSVDIFDDILLGYFKNSVRDNCDSIDMNIIQAIAQEYRLKNRIKMMEEQAGTKEKVIDKVTHEDSETYIKETLALGRRLAAPGIQRDDDNEPREIQLCAYNKSLEKMRDYRIDDLVEGTACDTVSKYEIHFFNALYNLTPDKLNKFACPMKSKTGDREAGLYFQAYQDYSAELGPDSEKCKVISTHIDKRWDSVYVLPEMDMDYQAQRIEEIHKAFVYSLLYEIVHYKELSQIIPGRKVYRFENSDERLVEMIVSNGTLCDEFYEILDHFYISGESVQEVKKQVEKKRHKDEVRFANYTDTTFAKALKNFNLAAGHEGVTSLFEVPLMYYSSVPNSKRYDGEINELVKSIIDMCKDEIDCCESENDREPILWEVLVQQFNLCIDNYGKDKRLNCGLRLKDHPVIDIIYRSVKNVLGEENEEIADTLRSKINS